MAWIKEIPRKDGGITYRISWREPGSIKESTMTVRDDLERAKMNVRLLDANGGSLEAAQRAERAANIQGPTVAAVMEKHIDQLVNAEPETLRRYRAAIPEHFSGDLGKSKIAAVNHADIVLWIKYMRNKPSARNKSGKLSAKTIQNYHGLLHSTFETAIRMGYRTDNPCRGVKLPKDNATEQKMHFMSAEESLRIINAMPERYRPLLLTLRATGMRWGEATALFAKDFDLKSDPPRVRIERAWKQDGKQGHYLGAPKTKKSRRTVSLPPSLMGELMPLIEQAQVDGGHIFRDLDESRVRHQRFYNYWWRGLAKLGYTRGADDCPRVHDFRHTHASLMLAGGFDIFKLSRRLGHESIQTTVDRYSHLSPDAHFEGARVAEKMLELEFVGEIIEQEAVAS